MGSWEDRLGMLLMVRGDMYTVDVNQLWEYHVPEPAAAEHEVLFVQDKLGVKLSQDYIDFLCHANGWKCFYQRVDLFGTYDLCGDLLCSAYRMLNIELMSNGELHDFGQSLLPVALSRDDKDLFVLVVAEGESFGSVFWLAGGEVERFASFADFFDAMIEYNNADLLDLLSGSVG